jgi:hypothetical protein
MYVGMCECVLLSPEGRNWRDSPSTRRTTEQELARPDRFLRCIHIALVVWALREGSGRVRRAAPLTRGGTTRQLVTENKPPP